VAVRDYEAIFVGGGLAAMLLLRELGSALSGRVAVLDPCPPPERPTVHWSYWTHGATLYDRFAVGSWQIARVAETPAESIAPYTLRLVRSTDVFDHIAEELRTVPIEWLRTSARSIHRREDGTYEVITDAGAVRAGCVFDSVPDIEPAFPSPGRPRAMLSGTGVRVRADRPVFDAAAATLFDPLDERSFAYLLPLSPDEALLESATFDSAIQKENETPLLRYLQSRYQGASFDVTHVEHGHIPLGFAPSQTAGPRHVLLGTSAASSSPAPATAWSAWPWRANDWRSSGSRAGRCHRANGPPCGGASSTWGSCNSPRTIPGGRWLCFATSCTPFPSSNRCAS
jgi:lycopene beta-cyclase